MNNWLAEIEKKRKAFLNRPKETVVYEPRTKKDGWTYVTTVISANPSELYPFDKSIAKAIKEHTQGKLQPFWVTDVYRSPQGAANPHDEKFGRHVLALKCRTQEAQFFHAGQGYQIWLQLVAGVDSRAADLPKGYFPFDNRVLKYVQNNWRKATVKDIADQIKQQHEESEARAEKNRAEAERLEADVQRYAAKKLETISDVELKNYMLNKIHDRYEAKPTVLVGKSSK